MDATDVLINIRKIVRSINLESKKIQKDHGVSIPQVLCLNFLYNSDQYQATQQAVKRFLNLNASTVSGIVQRLEKKGLVARMSKKGDKRVTNLVLTASGLNLIKQLPPLLHDRLSHKLEKMDQAELGQIEQVLEKLVEILEIGALEVPPVIALDDDISS